MRSLLLDNVVNPRNKGTSNLGSTCTKLSLMSLIHRSWLHLQISRTATQTTQPKQFNRNFFPSHLYPATFSLSRSVSSNSVPSSSLHSSLKNSPAAISRLKNSPATKTIPFALDDVVELVVTDITHTGEGVAHATGVSMSSLSSLSSLSVINTNRGFVMVPFTIVGEVVEVRITHVYESFSRGVLLKVITPSPSRVTPKCALFAKCGGCQYQHLDYPAQLDIKFKQINELMLPFNTVVLPVIFSDRQYGYRSKLTPHFDLPYSLLNERDKKKSQVGG